MAWKTEQFPVGLTDDVTCQHDGCASSALFRFVSVSHVGERRSTARCNRHAESLASKLKLKPATPPVLEKIKHLVEEILDATAPKRPPLLFEIPKDAQPVTCSTCSESVVWIITKNLKKMPVEAFGPHRGESHFAFCPQANQHRKKK